MRKNLFSTVAGVVLCAAAFTSYKVYEHQSMSPQDNLLSQNLEVLTQSEQPDLSQCVVDRDCYCEALHPTDPDKDKGKSGYRW